MDVIVTVLPVCTDGKCNGRIPRGSWERMKKAFVGGGGTRRWASASVLWIRAATKTGRRESGMSENLDGPRIFSSLGDPIASCAHRTHESVHCF